MHPYQTLSLFTTGLVLAIWLIGIHALMLAKPKAVQDFLKKFPRDPLSGQILLGIGLGWFWLLIAPTGLGKLSALAMDLGEFNSAKGLLQILVPISLVLVCISVHTRCDSVDTVSGASADAGPDADDDDDGAPAPPALRACEKAISPRARARRSRHLRSASVVARCK